MSERYDPLPQDEAKLLRSSESDDNESAVSLARHWLRRGTWSSRVVTFLHWAAHISTIGLLAALLVRSSPSSSNPASSASPPLYAPAYGDDVKYNLHYTISQNEFWQKSPYKGPPTKEIVARWEAMTDHPVLNLTTSEIEQLGLTPDSAQYPASLGGGYMGYLESSHQLHCLHTIWATKHVAEYPELFPHLVDRMRDDVEIEAAHFEHCVDVIRQRLLCTADPSIVTFQWIRGLSTPYPNFHTGHMCADYDALKRWTERRKADLSLLEGWGWHADPAEGAVIMDKLP